LEHIQTIMHWTAGQNYSEAEQLRGGKTVGH
jgi:hypothetical protein